MLTKTARDQIIANAFQDEMLKIAAEDAIPGIDWDNLTEEQMEKLAKWFPGKFLARGIGKGVKAIGAGTKYVANKMKPAWEGGKKIVEGAGDIAKGSLQVGTGLLLGGVGIAGDATAAGLRGAGKYFSALGNEFKEGLGTNEQKANEGIKPNVDGTETGQNSQKDVEVLGDGRPEVPLNAAENDEKQKNEQELSKKVNEEVNKSQENKKETPALDENKKVIEENSLSDNQSKTVLDPNANKTPDEAEVNTQFSAEPQDSVNTLPDPPGATMMSTKNIQSNSEEAAPTEEVQTKKKPYRTNFGNAFASARSSGKETFTWNGNLYNTKHKGESDEVWRSNLQRLSQ